jgi:hypothetical protein|tara:strand:+ start:1218 stop:1430 length:213 start_codon:yes stop_codon:yes gene_type:complete
MIRNTVTICYSLPYGKKYLQQNLKSRKYPIHKTIRPVKIPSVEFNLKKSKFKENAKIIENYYKEYLRETL